MNLVWICEPKSEKNNIQQIFVVPVIFSRRAAEIGPLLFVSNVTSRRTALGCA